MPGSDAIGLSLNNPGDLTVNGPNSFLYPGQSGVTPHTFKSGHTLYFASFPDPTTGFNALVNSIAGRIGRGFNTVTTLVHQFLGTPTSNVDNPHVDNYITTVAATAGVGANDQLTTAQAQQIALGIAKAEGTSSIVPLSSASTGNNGAGIGGAFGVGSVNGFFGTAPATPNNSNVVTGGAQVDPGSVITGIADYPAAFLTGLIGGNTSTTVTGAPANNTPIAQTGADTGSGVNTAVSQGLGSLTSWLAQNAVVVALIAGAALVGVVAISLMFSNSNQGGTTHIVPVPV